MFFFRVSFVILKHICYLCNVSITKWLHTNANYNKHYNYMNEKRVYTVGNGKAEGRADMRNLLGGKGANLAEMNLIGVPVPPGFTITTDVCNEYFEKGKADVVSLLKGDVEKSISHIESLMGLRFGDAENPLLVSVRSGARASMPGMMDTILNLGLNDKVVVGLAKKTGNERFAYDSYRRFVQMYGDVVLGMKPVNKDDIDPFEAIIESVKAKRGIVLDNEMNVEELKELVSLFKAAIKERTGEVFPENPIDQLWGAAGVGYRRHRHGDGIWQHGQLFGHGCLLQS